MNAAALLGSWVVSSVAGGVVGAWVVEHSKPYAPEALTSTHPAQMSDEVDIRDSVRRLTERIDALTRGTADVTRREEADIAPQVDVLFKRLESIQARLDNPGQESVAAAETPAAPRKKDVDAIRVAVEEAADPAKPDAAEWRHHLWSIQDVYRRYGSPDFGSDRSDAWTYYGEVGQPGIMFVFGGGFVRKVQAIWFGPDGKPVR